MLKLPLQLQNQATSASQSLVNFYAHFLDVASDAVNYIKNNILSNIWGFVSRVLL